MNATTSAARMNDIEATAKEHEERLDEGAKIIENMRLDLEENTRATKRVEASTSEIVEFFNSVKGAFKVLNWIGKLARPMGAIIAFCVALWSAWLAFAGGSHPK